MTEFGLSIIYMVWLAIVLAVLFVAYEFSLFIRAEHKVTTMNGPWPTKGDAQQRKNNQPVTFFA
ncbi:hypothetical protein [Vibrio sp. MA40-2]|uniref:hypothetical protein n=1 Tax=Vibrio sp. MA40-2 TaxID=3391828 RepID=UPI0039A6A890